MNFQQDEKGLFTFYRQQAQMEEELKLQKKKMRLEKQKKDLQEKSLQPIQQKLKKKFSIEKAKQLSKPKTKKKFYCQPAYKPEKFDKVSLGQSVIIVNAQNKNKNHLYSQYLERQRSKSMLGKIQQKVQYSGHFIESKQLGLDLNSPVSSGQIQKQKKVTIKYYNNDIANSHRQSASLERERAHKLPSLGENQRNSSEYIIPKRYKSKKIQLALRSDSSEIIKKIRQSLQEQTFAKVKEQFSFRNYRKEQIKDQFNTPLLNGRQRRLIDILNSHKK